MGPPQCPRDTLGIPSVPTGPPQCPRGLAGRSCARLPEGHTPGLARPEGRAGTAPQRPGAPLGTRGKEKAQTSHGSGSERGKGREGKAPTSRSRRRRRCASSGTCWRLGTAGSGSAGTAGTAGAARCRDPSAARAAAPSAAALAHAHTNSTKKVISFSRRGHGLFATSRCKYRISSSGWTTGSAARTPCHPRTSNIEHRVTREHRVTHGHRVTHEHPVPGQDAGSLGAARWFCLLLCVPKMSALQSQHQAGSLVPLRCPSGDIPLKASNLSEQNLHHSISHGNRSHHPRAQQGISHSFPFSCLWHTGFLSSGSQAAL